MNNYAMINGKKIELTQDQIDHIIQNQKKMSVQLSEIAEGDTFKIGAHEFIVLEQQEDTTAVIRKELLPDQKFGKTNNFEGSDVDKTCYEFAANIAAVIGEENIVEHTVDLTSNDGMKDYGATRCFASLLTADRYRRYVEILDKFKPDQWWWLATPFSTKLHDNDSWVLCVSPSGCFSSSLHYCSVGGVRPFCILKSTIFVSK